MASTNRSARGRTRRGFAAMDPEERREISRRGGTASHASGRGHEFNSQEAREAGRRGGEARWGRGRSEEEEPGRAGRQHFEREEERGVEYDPAQRLGAEEMPRRGASSSSRSRGRSRND